MNYVLLVCIDCPGRDAYTVSDVVLVDGFSGINYILNLFWGIVLNWNEYFFVMVLHWAITLVWSNDQLICMCVR